MLFIPLSITWVGPFEMVIVSVMSSFNILTFSYVNIAACVLLPYVWISSKQPQRIFSECVWIGVQHNKRNFETSCQRKQMEKCLCVPHPRHSQRIWTVSQKCNIFFPDNNCNLTFILVLRKFCEVCMGNSMTKISSSSPKYLNSYLL